MNRRRLLYRVFDTACGQRVRGCRAGLRILLYHGVGAAVAADTYGMTVGKNAFRRQMKILAGHPQWRVISLESGMQAIGDSPRSHELCIAVTFDDGYRSVLENAAPVLLEFGIPFTVFVTVDWLPSAHQSCMSTSELRSLAELPGVCIGSHGMSHHRLSNLSEPALYQELFDSRMRLQEIIGRPVTAVSYPHGALNQRVLDTARRAGYRIGAGSIFGINRKGGNTMKLKRTELWADDTEETFKNKCRGMWDLYAGYQMLRGN